MKKRMILAFAALLVFGLSIATFAYKQTTTTNKTAMSCCCCHGDSCPMKNKDSLGKDAASCCDKDDCKGDSCPMKKKDASGKETSCCDDCDCCKGDSKAAPKTVAYYFKGQPLYKTGKSKHNCCGEKTSQKS